MQKPISLNDLAKFSGAWLDISSLGHLSRYFNVCPADLPDSPEGRLMDRTAKAVLARLVAYENFFVDEEAMQTLGLTLPSELSFVVPVKFDQDFYHRLFASSERSLEFLRATEAAKHEFRRQAESVGRGASRFDARSTSRSGDNYMRALLYFELARVTHKTVFISEGKISLLRGFEADLGPDTLAIIQKLADDAFGVSDAMAIASVDVPPLGEFIWNTACAERRSLVEVLAELRAEPRAVAFRGLLMRLEESLRRGFRESSDDLLSLTSSLREAAERFGNRIGGSDRAFYRRISLAGLPLIGHLLETVDLRPSIPDYELFKRPDAWGFITRWYTPLA